LPPLEIYQSTAALYLLGTHKLGPDREQRICEDIQNTLQLYSDFINNVKGNARLWQALFDLYDTHRDKVGRIMYVTNRSNVGELAKSPALLAMEETRILLTALVSWVEGDSPLGEKTRRILGMDNLESILKLSILDAQQKRATIPAEATPVEKYRYELRLGLTALNCDAWSPYLTIPVKPSGFKTAVDMLFLNLIQEPVHGSDKVFSLRSDSDFELHPYELDQAKIPTTCHVDAERVFVSVADSGLVNWIKNDRPFYGVEYFGPNGVVPITTNIELKTISTCNVGMLSLYFGCDRTTIDLVKQSTPAKRLKRFFENNVRRLESSTQVDNVGGANSKSWYTITVRAKLADGRDSASLQSLVASERLPLEYSAALNSAANGVLRLDKLKTAFQYYVLSSSGELLKAKSFAERNSIDPYCLLFLVAILGRWDIFESTSAPVNFNYTFTSEGGTLTPLMLAAQYGREDVVKALCSKMTLAQIATQSLDKKTAGQYALEQGFYSIAYLLNAGLSPLEINQCEENLSLTASSVAIINPPNQLAIDLAQVLPPLGMAFGES
ncbi:MAG: hypothetical protein ACHP9Y_06250, partial [Gammaproteobacteria bacterium]